MRIPIIYLAAPFGGKPENLDRAEYWAAWLSRRLPALFVVSWVPLCRHWPNDGDTLKRGLELDAAAAERFDGLLMVGGCVSTGMDHDRSHSRNVYDCSEFETPERLAEDSDGHTFDMLFGWVREMAQS